MKRIMVRVNGSLAAALGTSRLTVQLPQAGTLADLLTDLAEQYPSCNEILARAVPMAGGKHLSPDTVLPASQEVALLMPIAGGSHCTLF